MIDRANVLMVMYDLPTTGNTDNGKSLKFRKELKKLGYITLQRSVFVKLIRYGSEKLVELDKVRRIAPNVGDINMLEISLNSFRHLYSICGDEFDMALFADDLIEI